MSFIFFLILLAIFIIILVPTFLFSLIRTILSMLGFMFTGRRRRHTSSYESGRQSAENKTSYSSSTSRKKMFDKDEGEYVDFEEIKDDK